MVTAGGLKKGNLNEDVSPKVIIGNKRGSAAARQHRGKNLDKVQKTMVALPAKGRSETLTLRAMVKLTR
jgi:hypothetical protein